MSGSARPAEAISPASFFEFFKELMKYAVPSTLLTIFLFSRELMDIVMVGQLGTPELAAVGFSGKVLFLVFMLQVALANGGGVFSAQYFGKGDTEGVRTSAAISLLHTVGVTLPVVAALVFLPEQIMRIGSSDPEVIALGEKYLRIMAVNVLLNSLSLPFLVGLRTIKRTVIGTVINSGGVALNVLLNYFLIFGNAGFPKLGIAGAAVSTAICGFLQFSVLFSILRLEGGVLKLSFGNFAVVRDKSRVSSYRNVSLPIVASSFVWSAGLLVYSVVYGHVSTDSIAAMAMLGPIETVASAFFIGIASGASVILGHFLGRADLSGARAAAGHTVALTCAVAIVIGALLLASQTVTLGIFGGAASSTLSIAGQIFPFLCLGIALKAFTNVAVNGILKSGGDTKFFVFVDLLAQWGIAIPLVLFGALVLHLPLWQVFLLVLVEDVVKLGFSAWRVSSGKWVKKLV